MPTHLAIRTRPRGIPGRIARTATAIADYAGSAGLRTLAPFAGLVAIVAAMVVWAPASHAATSVDSTATLTWTAPGDDGNTGTASSYDLRYRTVAPTGTDTLTWWNAATKATGLPHPGASGSTDSVQVRNLDPTKTYYFILKVGDEVPNWSTYSNMAVRTPYVDHTPPAAISDLSVALVGPTMPELPAGQGPAPGRR